MAIARTWRDSVLDALHRVSVNSSTKGMVDRATLITKELDAVILETASQGATPEQTLSRVLQQLRNEGEIEFAGNGVYRLVAAPLDMEEVDLSDTEIDSRLRRKLLHIGRVETDAPLAIARRRRGQDRLRTLTLHNYGMQCALCDIKDAAFLIASHIVPWSVSVEARGDLANVMCLCRFHDALFELGYWSLDCKHMLVFKQDVLPWAIKSLLPSSLEFQVPMQFPPAEHFLKKHRLSHDLD